MSGFATRWPVLLTVPVSAEGPLSEAEAERIVDEACEAYFALCSTVSETPARTVRISLGNVGPDEQGISVSANVVEVYPDSFVVHALLRPATGVGIAARAVATFTPAGGVPDAMRDEFIALAHGAQHVH